MTVGAYRAVFGCLTEVQRFFSTYGAAAHLAILAVAPLFLFAFFDAASVAKALLWLTLPAAAWVFASPMQRPDEHGGMARRRVRRANLTDPVFWILLAVSAFAGLRALNGGIALAYDAEAAVWNILPARIDVFPGVLGSAGFLPFATALSALVVVQGVRHSLRSFARLFFLLAISSLAGLSVVLLVILPNSVVKGILGGFSLGGEPTVALAYAVYAISGLSAISGLFELRWHGYLPLGILAVGGCLAGCFLTGPCWLIMATFAALILVFLYAFVYSCIFLRGKGSGHLQFLALTGMALGGAAAIVWWLLPAAELEAKLAAICEFKLFADGYDVLRTALSDIARRTWIDHLWIGTGLGSFPLDFRFGANEEMWVLLPRGATMSMNGWWHLLAERGIVGTVLFVLPAAALVFDYIRRMANGVRETRRHSPLCLLAPLVLALAIGGGFFEGSFMRSETLLAVAAVSAVSASAFVRKGSGGYGG